MDPTTNSNETVRINIRQPTASGNRRGWHKLLTGIDASKSNGYAFSGDFLNDGLHDVPAGSVILEVYPTGSAKHGGKGALLYVAETGANDGNADSSNLRIASESTDWLKRCLEVRDKAAELLAANARATDSADPDADLANAPTRTLEIRDHEEACMLSVALRAVREANPHWDHARIRNLISQAEDIADDFKRR